MKQGKRIISSLLVLAMAFTLVFVPNTASAKTMTVKQILTKSEQAAQKVKSSESTINVNLKMKMENQPLNITAKCNIINFANPLKTKMTTSINTGLLGNIKLTTYVAEEKDNITTYLLLGDTWYKQVVPKDDDSATTGLDAETVAALNNSTYKNFKVASTKEKVNGSKTYTLKGSISGKLIQTVLDEMDMDEIFEESGLDTDIYNTNKNVSVKVWIDQKTMLPLKYTIDMGDYMNSVFKNAKELGDCSVSKYTITMTFKNYNKAKNFSIPSAAKQAEDLSAPTDTPAIPTKENI